MIVTITVYNLSASLLVLKFAFCIKASQKHDHCKLKSFRSVNGHSLIRSSLCATTNMSSSREKINGSKMISTFYVHYVVHFVY